MRVLIIEDDHVTAQSMEMTFKSEGFNVYTTDLGEEGLDVARIYDYDLITLDLGLPDADGHTVLVKMRAAGVKAPVMIVSGRHEVESKVRCLNAGADDYLTKPFHRDELLCRAMALVRRAKGHVSNRLKVGNIVVDVDAHVASVDGKQLHLTGKEYQMLEVLALRAGSTLTKENLLNHLYGGMDEPELKIIDVFICKLRKKLSDANGGLNHIETVWGRGYRLVDQPVAKGSAAFEAAVNVRAPKRERLSTQRGRMLAIMAGYDKPVLLGSISVKMGMDSPLGLYAPASVGRRDGLIASEGKRGETRYSLTPKGWDWLTEAGWTPAPVAAAA